MNDRSLQILKLIVERYIRDGQPVGSKAIAEEASLALSPATVRNIMADLEEAGYIRSPHTSAGRIPTSRGYRLFVNTLLTVQPFHANEINQLREQLPRHADSATLVETASNMLSQVTKLAGLVTIPRREQYVLSHIEFLPLSGNRVLVIMVINETEVQNQIIYTDRPYSPSELQQAGNYLVQEYSGKDLQTIQQVLMADIQLDRANMEAILLAVKELASKAFDEQKNEDYVLAGQSHLLELAEQAGIDRLRSLFEALAHKRNVLHLLEACVGANGVQIFIGQESGYEELDACSIVTTPYSVAGKVLGVLGVIGPTRMPYDRVISAVDVTAKLLSAALSDKV